MKRYHEVKITVDMVRRAQSMAKTHGSNSNTIKKRERSRFTGYLGEELVAQFISGLTRANCKDYDFIRWKGSDHSYSIDVKTKERGVLPADKWSVHIGEYGSHQQCDTYVFAQVNETEQGWRGWVIGWMDKKEYWDTALKVKKGDVVEGDDWPEYADGRKMYFRDLHHY